MAWGNPAASGNMEDFSPFFLPHHSTGKNPCNVFTHPVEGRRPPATAVVMDIAQIDYQTGWRQVIWLALVSPVDPRDPQKHDYLNHQGEAPPARCCHALTRWPNGGSWVNHQYLRSCIAADESNSNYIRSNGINAESPWLSNLAPPHNALPTDVKGLWTSNLYGLWQCHGILRLWQKLEISDKGQKGAGLQPPPFSRFISICMNATKYNCKTWILQWNLNWPRKKAKLWKEPFHLFIKIT